MLGAVIMFKVGFSNDKYVELQSERIRERVDQFGGKLYLEFGGKLFDDYHASRVLPGFEPDSKIRMLKALSDDCEIVIAINADAIEKNKRRGDLGITYDQEVLRLIDAFTEFGLFVGSVVITQFAGQHPELRFLVTRVGCGIAGRTVNEIAPLFKDCIYLENVALPAEFWKILGLTM